MDGHGKSTVSLAGTGIFRRLKTHVIVTVRSVGTATSKSTPPGQPAPSGAPTTSTPSPNSPSGGVDRLDVQSVIVEYGQTVQLSANVVQASSEPKKGKALHPQITFSVNGKVVGSALPGQTVPFAPPDSMPAGKYPITATFDDLQGSALLTLTKAKTTLAVKQTAPDASHAGTVAGTIYLNRATDKAPIDGRAVQLLINRKPVATLTTDHGVVSFDWHSVPKSKIQDAMASDTAEWVPVEAKFGGDEIYQPTHDTTNFDVKVSSPRRSLAWSRRTPPL